MVKCDNCTQGYVLVLFFQTLVVMISVTLQCCAVKSSNREWCNIRHVQNLLEWHPKLLCWFAGMSHRRKSLEEYCTKHKGSETWCKTEKKVWGQFVCPLTTEVSCIAINKTATNPTFSDWRKPKTNVFWVTSNRKQSVISLQFWRQILKWSWIWISWEVSL